MKILLCSVVKPSKQLGMSKVLIELAEELEKIGWICDLISPNDICPDIVKYRGQAYINHYCESLQDYLVKKASEYDVIDYDHLYLPYSREKFSRKTLFVARSALLLYHFQTYPIPFRKDLRGKISNIVKGYLRKSEFQNLLKKATITLQECDLINVNNNDAKIELVKRGFEPNKIVVIPLGINEQKRSLFNLVSSIAPKERMVCFVGTFDLRKGANDFPEILQNVASVFPDIKFRLMGTQGLFQTEKQVIEHFPQNLRNKIEVIPRFHPEELPNLLASCSVGIFPSYLEGFGLGVLEMLAASIPVIAYDVPGPPMMLPPEYLVSKGDIKDMSDKVITLLHDQEKLKAARLWAKQHSQEFNWKHIAQTTSETYLRCLEVKRTPYNKSRLSN